MTTELRRILLKICSSGFVRMIYINQETYNIKKETRRIIWSPFCVSYSFLGGNLIAFMPVSTDVKVSVKLRAILGFELLNGTLSLKTGRCFLLFVAATWADAVKPQPMLLDFETALRCQ